MEVCVGVFWVLEEFWLSVGCAIGVNFVLLCCVRDKLRCVWVCVRRYVVGVCCGCR